MAGGSKGGELTAAAVLTPCELQQHAHHDHQDVEAGAGSTLPHAAAAAAASASGHGRSGSGSGGGGGGLYSVAPPPKQTQGPSRGAVRGLWAALVLSLLALAATVGLNLYMLRERRKEAQANLHLASGTTANSSNALGMARAAQDRSIRLEQEVEMLQLQFNATLQQLAAQQAAAAAAADARWLAQCEALLAQQGEEEEAATAGDAATRTAYVCQAETGWALKCPGGGAPTVAQALIGRFTSAPDGPCSDGARPGQLALCPASADVTPQVRLATRGGGAVGKSPLALLSEAGRANPCPRALLQLQVLYSCPAAPRADPAARAERCRQALVAAGGTETGAGMYGAAPQKKG